MRTYWRAVWVAAGFAAACGAQEWDRFRGPNGGGVGAADALPLKLDVEKNLLWRRELPPGHSSPVVRGMRIALTAFEGERLFTYVFALDGGRLLWRAEAPRPRKEKLDKLNSPASPTPALDDTGVYVFFGDYGLLAYGWDGTERWRTPLGPFHVVYGMGVSPIVAGGSVVLVADHGPGSWIAAFDKRTGKERWRTPRPEALSGSSTPIVWTSPAGRMQVIAPASFRMDAYDLETGRVEWFVRGLPSEMKSTPALYRSNGQELILVSGFNTPENDPGRQVAYPPFEDVLARDDKDKDGRLAAAEATDARVKRYFPFIDLNGDGFMDSEEWRLFRLTMEATNAVMAIRPGGSGDRTAEAVVWRYHRSVPQCPSPVVHDGLVYMLNDKGVLTVLDAATGELVRQARLRGVADDYYASPVAAGGSIWMASFKGVVAAVKPGREDILNGVTDLGEEITATPAAVGGRLLVRTSKALYVFGRPR